MMWSDHAHAYIGKVAERPPIYSFVALLPHSLPKEKVVLLLCCSLGVQRWHFDTEHENYVGVRPS